MKKILFTLVFATAALFASAQFMVVTTINQPEGEEEWGMESFTDNLGIGFMVNDKFTVGAAKNGTTMDTTFAEDGSVVMLDTATVSMTENDGGYNIFLRYNYNENIYISLDMPTEDATENMNLGVGYSFAIWNDLYIEPNYKMPLKKDSDGKREGNFNFGIAYRF